MFVVIRWVCGRVERWIGAAPASMSVAFKKQVIPDADSQAAFESRQLTGLLWG